MMINVTGCTADDALEALSLLDGVDAFEVVSTSSQAPASFFKLPATGSQRQRVLLYFLRENGPRSRDDVKSGLSLDDGSADPRCLELIQGGWLVETDKARSSVKLAKRDWFPLGIRVDV
jgi:hypothetical protein